MATLVLIHAGATLFMTGLIWFVQVVHYPLMAQVGRGDFVTYEQHHTSRTGKIVGPVMAIEAVTAVILVILPPAGTAVGTVWLGLGLLVGLWTSTALLQVPCHRILSREFSSRSHRRLVRTNWIRTVAWSLRSLLALQIVSRHLLTGG